MQFAVGQPATSPLGSRRMSGSLVREAGCVVTGSSDHASLTVSHEHVGANWPSCPEMRQVDLQLGDKGGGRSRAIALGGIDRRRLRDRLGRAGFPQNRDRIRLIVKSQTVCTCGWCPSSRKMAPPLLIRRVRGGSKLRWFIRRKILLTGGLPSGGLRLRARRNWRFGP